MSDNSTIAISDSVFKSNMSNSKGSAIFSISCIDNQSTIFNCVFEDNIVYQAGTIFGSESNFLLDTITL